MTKSPNEMWHTFGQTQLSGQLYIVAVQNTARLIKANEQTYRSTVV